MKESLPAGAPINWVRYQRWLNEFEGYRHQVTRGGLENWLNQFANTHRDVAARTLDCVDFIGAAKIDAAFRQALGALPGWNVDPQARQGRWRFVPFSTSAGESGDEMIHRFRRANNLGLAKFNDLFIHPSSLMQEKLSATDTVVFVDDFSGSGRQAVDKWRDVFAELLAEGPTVYLVLVAAATHVNRLITDETGIRVICDVYLHESDNIFSDTCTRFSVEDKRAIRTYCRRADNASPNGYGNCGLLVVFAHDCPNNSIPILHKVSPTWNGIFPRT